jgi:hypothetical protein
VLIWSSLIINIDLDGRFDLINKLIFIYLNSYTVHFSSVCTISRKAPFGSHTSNTTPSMYIRIAIRTDAAIYLMASVGNIWIHLCIYSGASVHERPCSRTIRFTNKFSEQKTSRMTNGFSDYEHANWQQRQAESISAGVSCCLTLAQYTSLLDFGLRTFRFTNGLQERIKFVNRGPTVTPFQNLFSVCPDFRYLGGQV